MALGSTQARTEMSTRNLPGGKGRPARKADSLTAICEPIVKKMWEPRRLTTLWASTARYRDSFTDCLYKRQCDTRWESNLKALSFVTHISFRMLTSCPLFRVHFHSYFCPMMRSGRRLTPSPRNNTHK
jgi:hypothetical protein